jgi:tetratricopeptide (TPR) repeat protein
MSEVQRAKGIGLLGRFLKDADRSEKKSDYNEYVSRAYLSLASSYSAQGRPDLAFDAAQHSLDYDASFVAYTRKCGLLAELGKPAEALQCFQKCLTLNPWDAVAYHNIGSLYASNRSLDEAVKFFKISLSIDPAYVGSYRYLGNALVERGDLSGAIYSFEKALTLEPRATQIYWDCALALHMEGRDDSALEYIQSGLHYAPSDRRGLDLLSKAQASIGKTSQVSK